MDRLLEILMISVIFCIGYGEAIDCFHCAYIAADNSSSKECLNHNTTSISACSDSTACIQLSYQDPDTSEYVSYFLGCGTDQCDESNSNGVEAVEHNSAFKNYTLRKTCCQGDYCNCNSSTCSSASIAHEIALNNEETTAMNEYTTESEMVDCFHCVHVPQANITNTECTKDNTTSITKCPGNLCMKLILQRNDGSSDYSVYSLDCASEIKCNDSIADGVERSTIDLMSGNIERVTCCAGDYCNCDSPSCMKAASITTTTTGNEVTKPFTTFQPESTDKETDQNTKPVGDPTTTAPSNLDTSATDRSQTKSMESSDQPNTDNASTRPIVQPSKTPASTTSSIDNAATEPTVQPSKTPGSSTSSTTTTTVKTSTTTNFGIGIHNIALAHILVSCITAYAQI